MDKQAAISPCGVYRSLLTRVWDDTLPIMGWIQLNPSKADHKIDDPTLRRDIGFAVREGFGGVWLTNLYDFRATDPKDLEKAEKPISQHNDYYIKLMFEKCEKVVAGWGSNKMAIRGQGRVAELMSETDVLWCVGFTKDGFPRHPLYVKKDAPLIVTGKQLSHIFQT